MTFQSPMHAEPLRGRGPFADLVARSLAAARPLRFDVSHLAVREDVVMAEWTIAIERRESGARIEWRGMSVAEMRDGRIAVRGEYWDPAALACARGWSVPRAGIEPLSPCALRVLSPVRLP